MLKNLKYLQKIEIKFEDKNTFSDKVLIKFAEKINLLPDLFSLAIGLGSNNKFTGENVSDFFNLLEKNKFLYFDIYFGENDTTDKVIEALSSLLSENK